MLTTKLRTTDYPLTFAQKAKLLLVLLKFRLSFLVAFSAAFGYLLGIGDTINWLVLAAVSLGGFLVSGAGIVINQIIEKESDKLMLRTCQRPLPTEQISESEAVAYACIVGFAGLSLLIVFTNPLTALLSLVSLVLYAFVYTPLKKVGAIAVWVGAIPGALPPLLGWIAATGTIGTVGLVIFLVQFVWQFPHFWAIAWVADEDYRRAGIRLLPSRGGRDLMSAFQILLGTLVLIPVGLLPAYVGATGLSSAIVSTISAVLFAAPALQLLNQQTNQAAKKIMFASFIYLPVVQIALLLDKI